MFTVKNKETNKIENVYAAIPELSVTWFLFYEKEQWIWHKSSNYEPYVIYWDEPIVPKVPDNPIPDLNRNWWIVPWNTPTCNNTINT